MITPAPKRTHPTDEALAAWVDYQLGQGERIGKWARAEIGLHVNECLECRLAAAEITALVVAREEGR